MKKYPDFVKINLILLLVLPVLTFSQRKTSELLLEKKSPFVNQIENLEILYHSKAPLIFLEKVSAKAENTMQSRKKDVDYFSIENVKLKQLKDEKPVFFKQNITYGEKFVTLLLERVNVTNADFHILTDKGHKIFPENDHALFYRGIIKGSEKSIVTLSIFKDEFHYLISSEFGNYEIHMTEGGQAEGYFRKVNPTHYDQTDDLNAKLVPMLKGKKTSGLRSGNCIEIFIECDYHTHLALGNNLETTNVWINTLFNNVSAIYALHQVPIVLRQTFIWTSADPYTSATNPGQFRDLFVGHRQNNYNGRIAVLLSNRELGGGIANGIGGYCNTYPTYPGPQCVGTNLSLNQNENINFSNNVFLIAHEIGHVMGLRHTHACVWENEMIQIDDCGNIWAEQNGLAIEGSSCYNSGSPILPSQGTIMSNCHLLNQVGINLSNGFGPIAGKVLFEQYVYAPCVTGTSCNSQPPVNDICLNAIPIPVNHSCKNIQFSNHDATVSNNIGSFSCGNGVVAMKDIWFKIVIPPSGKVTVETSQTAAGLTDMVMEAYAGHCNNLQYITCDDDNGEGNHSRISLNNRISGEVIFLRVANKNDQYGMFHICAYDSLLPCHPDFAALMNFYNNTGGPLWVNKSGWQNGAIGTDCNVCNWFGIQCNTFGRVSTISLPANNITGNDLPADLVNLIYLRELKLYNNKISGTIPAIISQLSDLTTLDLGQNLISGPIPASLGNLTALKNLYLDNNQLTGNLPSALASLDLSLIYLNNNNLSGCIPAVFSAFCYKAHNFSNNTLLANGVSFDDFCSRGSGVDLDSDGYCRDGLDCNDNDPAIHPTGIETCNLIDDNCNGLTDDIAASATNTWVSGSGNWNNASNWSLGIIPERCQNVVIGGSENITITIPNGITAQARSVVVFPGKTLSIVSGAALNINHGLNLTNSGSIINHGVVNIANILDNSSFGINNNGVIINQTSGSIIIKNSGVRSFSNNIGGVFTNSGVLTIDKNAFNQSSTGLYNAGNVTNYDNISIRNITGVRIHITSGSIFTNQANGFLNIE